MLSVMTVVVCSDRFKIRIDRTSVSSTGHWKNLPIWY